MSEETKTPQEYWAGFPEAPFSDTFKWIDSQGFEHMTTVRGWQFSAMIGSVQKAEGSILDLQGKPINSKAQPLPPSASTIQVKDENGTPVVDADHNPVMATLPEGVHLFTVAGLVHDKNKDKTKDILKVFTVEAPYNKGYGVSCFHPPAELKSFTSWAVTSKENKAMYAPPASCLHVLIRDPKGDSKYADVVEFRP